MCTEKLSQRNMQMITYFDKALLNKVSRTYNDLKPNKSNHNSKCNIILNFLKTSWQQSKQTLFLVTEMELGVFGLSCTANSSSS